MDGGVGEVVLVEADGEYWVFAGDLEAGVDDATDGAVSVHGSYDVEAISEVE